jgi:hypothetical protein
VPLHRNLFCSHHSFLADGRLFVAGGQFPLPGLLKSLIPPKLLAPGADRDAHIFDPIQESWTRLDDMAEGRWYPTCATLQDGRVFVLSGTNGYAVSSGLGRGIRDTWEISDPANGAVGQPIPFGHHLFHLYPFAHVLPRDRLFLHFKRTTLLFNTMGGPTVRVAAGTRPANQTGETVHPYSRSGPGPGTCVLLPLLPSRDPQTGFVTYPAGRILILGGGGAEKLAETYDRTDDFPRSDGTTGYHLHSDTDATNSAEILDLAQPAPEWRPAKEWMKNGRVMPDSVLLPNGKVLVVGGGRKGQSGGLLAHFTSVDQAGKPDKGATDPVLEPEIFDPTTETWEQLCPKPVSRLYHTTAVLLPDARVLVAGHDGALNMPPYDASHYELELFSPPYLFGPDGQPATRPVITSAPARVRYGQTFSIEVGRPEEVASVALIRQSSVTHQINTDQRFVGLDIQDRDGNAHRVLAPTDPGVAPPGYYMLFVLNRTEVPSVARWVRLGRS